MPHKNNQLYMITATSSNSCPAIWFWQPTGLLSVTSCWSLFAGKDDKPSSPLPNLPEFREHGIEAVVLEAHWQCRLVLFIWYTAAFIKKISLAFCCQITFCIAQIELLKYMIDVLKFFIKLFPLTISCFAYHLGNSNFQVCLFSILTFWYLMSETMAINDPVAASAQRYKPIQSAVPGTTLGPIQINAFLGGGVCHSDRN